MFLNLNKSDRELEGEYKNAVIEGKIHRKKIVIIFLIVFVFLLVSIPTTVVFFIYQSFSSHNRVSNGAKVVGFLDNKYTEKRSTTRPNARYDVSYSFVVNDKTYTGSSTVFSNPVSKYVVVLYDPNDPNNNKLEGSNDSSDEYIVGIIAIIIFAVLVNLLIFAVKNKAKT